MAIKPVELQINIPKTTELSKVNSDEKQKEAAFTNSQAQNTMQESNEKLKKVHDKEKAEGLKLKKEQEEKNQKKKKKRKENNSGESGHVIDIEI